MVHLDTSRPPDARLIEIVRSTPGLTPPPFVTDTLTIGETTFTLRRHVLSFFQGNRFLLRDLVTHVVECLPAGGAVADLYAGVGSVCGVRGTDASEAGSSPWKAIVWRRRICAPTPTRPAGG